MIETFHEETIVDLNPKKAKGKSAVYNVAKYVTIASIIVAAFVLFLMFGIQYDETKSLGFWIPFGIVAIYLVLSIVFYFVFKNKRISTICSYDYTFVSGSLRIAKVLKDVKRKPVISIDCENISVMDKLSSDAAARYASMGGKKLIATPNVDNEEDQLYFAYAKQDGTQYYLVFEPSEVLRVHIKRASRALRTYRA